MQLRPLGQSGISVSPVTFGAWAIGGWMWGGQEHNDAIAAIRAALDCGITTIDTAAVYGFGESEKLVGEALRDVRREDVVLLTKFGLRWDHGGGGVKRFDTQDNDGNPLQVFRYASPESVKEECDRSLKRLGTDYIDVYQIHWPDPTTPIEDTFGAVAELIEAGKIRAAGVSNYSAEEMARAHAVTPLASSQPPFSMVNRQVEQDVIPWCRDHQVGVVAYSPLQRGLLTGKITENYQFGPGDHRAINPFFQPANVRRVNAILEQLKPLAQAYNATLAQLVIAWTIQQDGITAALVGARNVKQAQENARALEIHLTGGELRQIDTLLEGLELDLE